MVTTEKVRNYRSINNVKPIDGEVNNEESKTDATCYESLPDLLNRILVRGENYKRKRMIYDGDDLEFTEEQETSNKVASVNIESEPTADASAGDGADVQPTES